MRARLEPTSEATLERFACDGGSHASCATELRPHDVRRACQGQRRYTADQALDRTVSSRGPAAFAPR